MTVGNSQYLSKKEKFEDGLGLVSKHAARKRHMRSEEKYNLIHSSPDLHGKVKHSKKYF